MSLNEPSIFRLCQLVEQLCGIALDDSKMYLIRGRLRPLLEEFGFTDIDQLTRDAERPSQTQLRDRLVDALTTNETLFFRDRSPFDALRENILPELRKQSAVRRPRLRIWSAACSTGQEPYSIAMTLIDCLPDLNQWDVSILATDISQDALQRARSGIYASHEIDRGLSHQVRDRFFTRHGDKWAIQPEIRRMVRFEVQNLHRPPVNPGPFDVIFCRNVAIYFKADLRKALFERLTSVLTPDGYLFVGCSESLHDLGTRFKPIRLKQATCYRPNLAVAAR